MKYIIVFKRLHCILTVFPCVQIFQQQYSSFIDAFHEGKNDKAPRFQAASWSVLERVLAGKISSFV